MKLAERIVVLATLFAAPRFARAEPAHHTILYYISSAPLTVQTARPLVAYVDPEGRAVDWMFDGIIVYTIRLVSFPAHGTPTDADVAAYEAALFDQGQLNTLADVVAQLRGELHDPDYRLKVYLTVPFVQGPDCNAEIQKLLSRFQALNRPELELVGFYWGYNESADAILGGYMKTTSDFLHAGGYELLWIPYFNAGGLSGWRSYGVDRLALQPNFAFSQVGLERFQAADDSIRDGGLSGAELEFGVPQNTNLPPGDPELENAQAYLTAANQYNWPEYALTTYYHGSVIAEYASSTSRREIYDGLYRLISAHPRRSVVSRAKATPDVDAYVEQASQFQTANHGSATNLIVENNSFPNAFRTYFSFTLPQVPPEARLLSAHLQLTVNGFATGTSIDDGTLSLVEPFDFSESTLNANDQPTGRALSYLANYRIALPGSSAERHSLDITDSVNTATALGKSAMAFQLRRAQEDGGSYGEALLDSKEKMGGAAPTLELVYVVEGLPGDGGSNSDGGIGVDGGAAPEVMSDAAKRPCGCSSGPGVIGTLLAAVPLAALTRIGHKTRRPSAPQ